MAARSLAAQGLSIFGDHSDVMAVRQTGFALLASASVQEAHDLALVAQAATLRTRVPFVHFFDGFRTSHELNTIELLSDDDLRALVPEELVRAHRGRALSPERPFIRGTAQNPDVYFQARETVNPFYARVPDVVEDAMARLAERTGRRYALVDYTGHPEAERVLVVMGSGGGDRPRDRGLAECARRAGRRGAGAALPAVPGAGAARGAARDRAPASPCSTGPRSPARSASRCSSTSVAALTESLGDGERTVMPRVVGGRYGLSSKEFTPGMVAGVFDELARERPRRRFTIGINDDVSGTSLDYDAALDIEPPETVRAVFFGLGSDGTVGANKNTIKILGRGGPARAGLLRLRLEEVRLADGLAPALRAGADPGAVPRAAGELRRLPPVRAARAGRRARPRGARRDAAAQLPRTPPDEVWDALPRPVQEQILAKRIDVYVIDAGRIAREAGLAGRTNTVLQTCFFAISGVLPREQAIERIKAAIAKTYARRGAEVVERNQAAVDRALDGLHRVERARAGDGRAASCRRSCPRTRPSSCAP